MPRLPRPIASATLYHVIARCNNSDFLLKSTADFRLFLSVLARYKAQYGFKLFAYCLLNSHIHLVIQSPDTEQYSISKIMHAILWRFAFVYNRLHGRKGHFFNERFKSPIIESDSHGVSLIKYISQNPVRAGIVKNPRDWEWSSYRYYMEGEFDSLVDPLPSYLGLSARRLTRIRMIREFVEGEIMSQDSSWSHNYAVGTEAFILEIKKDFLGLYKPK